MLGYAIVSCFSINKSKVKYKYSVSSFVQFIVEHYSFALELSFEAIISHWRALSYQLKQNYLWSGRCPAIMEMDASGDQDRGSFIRWH